MKFYTESGRPASPDNARPILPEHYDIVNRRFGPSNHMAVAYDGREYILKGVRSFDVWDEAIYDKWVSHLTATQTRELDRVLDRVGGDIDRLLAVDWTKNPESMTARFARQLNALMTKEVDRAILAKTFFDTFQPLLLNAPIIYGHNHRFLSITRFDVHDARALDFLTKVGTDNADRAIGKYIDDKGSQAIIKIVRTGMKDGYGPDEVTSKVAHHVKKKIPMGKENYSRIVADQLMARSRSHSAVASMRQAGFNHYIWSSVLTETSCDFCTAEFTPIATEEGPMRAIDVPVGMRLLTKTQQWKRVKEKSIRIAGMWRVLRFGDESELIITPAHRISSNDEWTKASALINDDFVDTLTHDLRTDRIYRGEAQVKEARTRRLTGRAVNFEVEGNDPTYVAGSGISVVVHNCRYMHGKTISIADATAALDRAYQGGYTPEDLEKNSPWVKQTGNKLSVGGKTVATVTESGGGQWDNTGKFDDKSKNMAKLGMAAPPAHPMCYCKLIPMFSTRQLAPTITPAKVLTKAPVVKAAPVPAWLLRSAWAGDASLARVLAIEAQAWGTWLLDRRIPMDKFTGRHVREYVSIKPDEKGLDTLADAIESGTLLLIGAEYTADISAKLKTWRQANRGWLGFPEMLREDGQVRIVREAMARYPRLLAALHPDLFFFSLAWAGGKID